MTPATHIVSAIYRGPINNSIYDDWLGAHLVRLSDCFVCRYLLGVLKPVLISDHLLIFFFLWNTGPPFSYSLNLGGPTTSKRRGELPDFFLGKWTLVEYVQIWPDVLYSIYLEPKWPLFWSCFDWKKPCFGGVKAKNRGHLQVPGRYISCFREHNVPAILFDIIHTSNRLRISFPCCVSTNPECVLPLRPESL